MSAGGWHPDGRGWFARRDGATFTLARRLPLRWDISADSVLPDLARRRLAHAIRQDLWRMLQGLRGFSPAVAVTREAGACRVRAGGQVAGARPGDLADRIAGMLSDARHRSAWIRAAVHGGTP